MASLVTETVGRDKAVPGSDFIASLPHHLLLDILSYLDCKSLVETNRCSSSMCVLSRCLITRMPEWKTVCAESEEKFLDGSVVKKTIVEEVFPRTNSFPNLGFLFAQAAGVKDMEQVASALPRQAVVIGAASESLAFATACTDGGKCFETDYRGGGGKAEFTLSLANLPDTTRVGFHIPCSDMEDSDAAVKLVPDYTGDDEEGGKVIVVLYGGSGSGLDEFISSLQKKYPGSQIVGGIVPSRSPSMFLAQSGTLQTFSEGLLGVAIGGATVFSSQVSRACKPLSTVVTIAESNGPLLRSVLDDGVERPALNFLSDHFHSAMFSPFVGLSSSLKEGFTLHSVRGTTPDQNVVLTTDELKKGDFLQVFMLDPESTKEDLRERLAAAKRACFQQSKQALGGLLFTCAGRGKGFYGSKDVESKVFADAMPGAGLSGMFAGGEIGPEALAALPVDSTFRKSAQIQGFTAVFGVFFVPKFQRPTGKIVDDALASRSFHF